MTFDYDELENKGGFTTLEWVAECTDCDWMNRRSYEASAQRSADAHERSNEGHTVTVEQGEKLYDGDTEDGEA